MLALLKREILLTIKEGLSLTIPIVFYMSVLTATTFAIGPDSQLLSQIGVSLLWIALLFSCLLGLDRLFQPDHHDGTLDQYLLLYSPLVALVFIKGVAHWLTSAVPLVLLSPLFGFVMTMDTQSITATFLTLLVGSPAISFIGVLGATLTLSLPRSGMLLAILVLPFCLPIIIFGVGSVQGIVQGTFPQTFMILCSLSLFFIAICPIFSAMVLRHRS